jgi:hypothetical protein
MVRFSNFGTFLTKKNNRSEIRIKYNKNTDFNNYLTKGHKRMGLSFCFTSLVVKRKKLGVIKKTVEVRGQCRS